MPMSISLHVAFQVALPDLQEAPSRLQKACIQQRSRRSPNGRAGRVGPDARGCGLLPRSGQ
jgi:hypothetical protein